MRRDGWTHRGSQAARSCHSSRSRRAGTPCEALARQLVHRQLARGELSSLGVGFVVLANTKHITADERCESLDGGDLLDGRAGEQRGVDGVPVADELVQVADGLAAGEEQGSNTQAIAANEADARRREGGRLVCASGRVSCGARAGQRGRVQARKRSDMVMRSGVRSVRRRQRSKKKAASRPRRRFGSDLP